MSGERSSQHLRAVGEQTIDGAELLDDVERFVARFCAFPDEHCLTAVTLWAAHTHMIEFFYTTPRLALLSPEAASGKTRVLEILNLLAMKSQQSIGASPAAIFRMLADRQITLLFDEVDAIWNRRGKDDAHEDLRAMLNAGYKRGASIPRCVGATHEVRNFKVYCAVALAGLGDLPDTIMSRSVIIRMRPRAPHEQIEPFYAREHEPLGYALRDRIADWAAAVGETVGESRPMMPPGVVDRPAEMWEPLIAIADAAGGAWPGRARAACEALCKVGNERQGSLRLRLLEDLWVIFGEDDALHTGTLLERLVDSEQLPDAPWAELRGKPLSSRKLASMLRDFGIRPKKITIGGRSLQGYRREDLWDTWVRYFPSLFAVDPELPELLESARPNRLSRTPEVPDIPMRERACPQCDGEGCDLCGEWKQ